MPNAPNAASFPNMVGILNASIPDASIPNEDSDAVRTERGGENRKGRQREEGWREGDGGKEVVRKEAGGDNWKGR